MINNAWKINDGDRNYGKGWTNKEETPNKAGGAQGNGGRGGNGAVAGSRPGTSSQQQPQTYSRP